MPPARSLDFFSLQPSSHIPGVEALHFTIGDFESLHLFFSEDRSLLLIPRSVASVLKFFFLYINIRFILTQ